MQVHGSQCRLCKWYRCEKTPRPEQGHCEFPVNKFERKE
jgi:hypothetical protein